ncbi:membrane protein [Sesbania bispinosa]|nr:membrane protein [Sesbania bispinosa]
MAQTVKSNPQRPSTSQSINLPTQNKFIMLAPPIPSKPSEIKYQYKEKPESLPLV